MPVKAVAGLADAAQFHIDVGAGGDGVNAAPPLGQHFLIPVGVGADPQQPADMVKDQGQIREGLGQGRHFLGLMKVGGQFQQQPLLRQDPSPVPEVGLPHPFRGGPAFNFRVGVIAAVGADAAKAVGAGRLQRSDNRFHPGAQIQIGRADNGGRRPGRAVDAAGPGRRQALHKLHLAHRPQLLRAVGPVH